MAPAFCNRCGDAVVEEECDPKDELAELDALLERLTFKRYDLKRKINRFYSPIIRLLPPDVMSTIFEFCLPDSTVYQTYRFGKLFTPLSLGAISSYWRDIAWSTPSLWSSLVVRDPNRHAPHLVTGMAQEWLGRSGRLPLFIQILSTFDNESVSALVDVINQYSNRWSDLDLDIPERYYQLFHATDNHAPILKSIRFHCPYKSDAISTSNLNLQLTCPRLERACLTNFPLDGTNIQWDNLTHLTLHYMSIFDSFIILRKTPRLVFCEGSGSCSYRRFEEGDIEAPVLTSLRSLQLGVDIDAGKFLENLIAPHLEEFSLPRYYSPSIEVITSFLRRSACSLRSLSITFQEYSERYMNLLQSIPSLNTLSIRSLGIGALAITSPDDHDSRNIFQLVAKVLSSQSTSLRQGFLPNLKILEYTGELYYLQSGIYEDLYPLPPVDNAVHGPLRLLELDFYYSTTRVPKKLMSYISSLEERGVTVNVLSYSENILQSSIDYYKCREDFLCQDWTENFDSTLFS